MFNLSPKKEPLLFWRVFNFNVMEEIWKDVTGYEGLYQVSNLGRVKRLKYYRENILTGGLSLIKSKILKPVKHCNGYLFVSLCDGNQTEQSIHRLVATAFILNPENKPQINHKSGIKTVNFPENLEWCTASENILHAYKTGLRPQGENHHKAKLKGIEVYIIRTKYKTGLYSLRELSKLHGIGYSSIRDIVTEKTWKHGYHANNDNI